MASEQQGKPRSEGQSTSDWFLTISSRCSLLVGSRWAFLTAIAVVLFWAISGPHYHYSDTWQLVINTGTTIVTFLMVFLIQHTQNRDAKAINLKLDEIIFALGRAKNDLIEAEKLSDEELAELEAKYANIRAILDLRKKTGNSQKGANPQKNTNPKMRPKQKLA
jgi:low affinity Fe/Cu permease